MRKYYVHDIVSYEATIDNKTYTCNKVYIRECDTDADVCVGVHLLKAGKGHKLTIGKTGTIIAYDKFGRVIDILEKGDTDK